MFNQVCELLKTEYVKDEVGNTVESVTSREVYCREQSVKFREFYAASETGLRPDIVLVIADYYDYNLEPLVRYQGEVYNVLRTYRTGTELELTLSKRTGHIGEA